MVVAGLLALFILTLIGLAAFRRFALRNKILLDIPNARSNHSAVTVRGAGIIFVLSTLLGWGVLMATRQADYLLPLIAAGLAVALVSFVDDIRGLPISTRLCGHLVAALLFLSAIPLPAFLEDTIGDWAWLWTPVAAFFMVAVINIYNFMDGIDGLASIHSLCVLLSWILFSAASLPPSTEMLMCLCLVAPLLAFLIHNWSPAKVFMGDVGSTFLGLSFAALAVIQAPGILRSTNFLTLIMLMMPFLFDATFTIIVRFLSGEKWYQAHTSHLFQRMVRAGASHSVVSSLYGLLTLYMGAVVVLVHQGVLKHLVVAIPLFVLPYLGLYYAVLRMERARAVAATV